MHHYAEAHHRGASGRFAARAQELEDEKPRHRADTVMAFSAEPIMGGGGVILPLRHYASSPCCANTM